MGYPSTRCKKDKCPIYYTQKRILRCVDTDGNLDVLIPLFIEAGVNVVGLVEVQVGINLVDLRRRFGAKMAYIWG